MERTRLCPDEELSQAVRHLRAGVEVEESFRVVDEHLRSRLLKYFQFHGFGSSDAEDLVQTTLANVFQGVRSLECEESFMGWLFAIARNAMITASGRLKGTGHTVPLDLAGDPNTPEDPPDQVTIEDQVIESVWTAIEQLPPQQRQCLVLRVRDELSYEEIAETLRLSLNTVRNHLVLAKANLRRVLKTEPEESQ
ncbi:MAG: sigma-70 family RNA polymerase sigma factor [Acidobacteria bacterium]|nr:sigma-70 family RNA polymerase sigma factor [Acidobacteriota bacterium]